MVKNSFHSQLKLLGQYGEARSKADLIPDATLSFEDATMAFCESLLRQGEEKDIADSVSKKRTRRKPKSELGQERVSSRAIDDILPSPENDTLYRPVDTSDPAIVALADDISRNGILNPLVVTKEGFLVSGHRRLAAARLAGLRRLPVLVHPIGRWDPEFVSLLASFNKQREKTLDEKLRESIVESTREEAYAALLYDREERSERAIEDCQMIEMGDRKKRCRISPAKSDLLEAVKAVIEKMEEFWPLSDRLIHYQLLNSPPLIHASKPASRYRNDKASYKALTELLTRARIAGDIPFDVSHDPTRPVQLWATHNDAQAFFDENLPKILKGYFRNLLQSQPNHIEVVGEKNTIESIIKPICRKYTVPYTIGRGFASLTPRYEIVQRFLASNKSKLVVIFLSDCDPDGDMIAQSLARSLRDDFAIESRHEIIPVRAALTPEQVAELGLPPGGKAKPGSTNYARFIRDHATDDVYELEAVPPETLQSFLDDAIRNVIDVDLYNAEVELLKSDAKFISDTRQVAQKAIAATMGREAP